MTATSKKCGTCQKIKNAAEFGVNNVRHDGLQAQCRDCKKQIQSRWYANNKERHVANVNRLRKIRALAVTECLLAYLQQHPCVECGENHPLLLEFDHVRGAKRGEIAQMVSSGLAWATILSEIAKCDVRCVKCHRLKTAEQFGFNKFRLLPP